MLWLPEQKQPHENLICLKDKNAGTAVEEQYVLCHLVKLNPLKTNKEPFSDNIKDWDFIVC